jgi:flagellar basal-body rod modification protein FlgD
MPINATASPTSYTNPTANPTSIERPDQFGKDTFMKLLVAQLKYQNPMQPTDPSAMLSQSAQFAVIEKLSELTKTQAAESKLTEMTTSAAFIGKRVSYLDNGETKTGVVTSVKFESGKSPSLQLGTNPNAVVALTDVIKVDNGT